jgi:GntR family transcriptional regulator
VVRRQGRGTFVVEHTPAHVLFRFFSIYDETGTAVVPDSKDVTAILAVAEEGERRSLGLKEGDRVVRIGRTRTRGGLAFIRETIAVPEALFPGLIDRPVLPNTLYDLYQKEYGVLVMRTDDSLSAVAADATTAGVLGIAAGEPLLRIERVAYGLDDRRVEWRVSLCHLGGARYLARAR